MEQSGGGVEKLFRQNIRFNLRKRSQCSADSLSCMQVKRKENIEVCTTNEIENIIKTRLNMQALKCNYKGKDKEFECPLCKEEQDTTEHIFKCKVIQRILGTNEIKCKDVESEDIKVLKKVSQYMTKAREIREQL